MHLIAAIMVLITGTAVLMMRKGTEIHRKIGFAYGGAITVVVATACMIYKLFCGWDIFHWAAVVSGVTLAGGMIPVLLRRPDDWWSLLLLSQEIQGTAVQASRLIVNKRRSDTPKKENSKTERALKNRNLILLR